MAMPWFRLYSEFRDETKIQKLSEAMQRRYIMLLCSRCKEDKLDDETIAFQWRVSPIEVAETKRKFIEIGLIDDAWNVLAWDKRQFRSDDVNARVRKTRANATPLQRYKKRFNVVSCNGPDTEADTDNYSVKQELGSVWGGD